MRLLPLLIALMAAGAAALFWWFFIDPVAVTLVPVTRGSAAEVVYATGDKNLNDSSTTAFSLIHLNRTRPGLILGRELMGTANSNSVAKGNLLSYGTTGTFSGLLFIRPGFRVDWSPSWASGAEVIIAKKAATPDGASSNLGWEIDFGTDYNVYKNFDLGLNMGFAFPGEGIALPAGGERKSIFAVRTTAALKF